MAQTLPRTGATEPTTSDLLGLGVLRNAWALFRAHWWELVAVGACAYVATNAIQRAAVAAGSSGAVPGLLVFSLLPAVPLVATVLMLLLLRSRTSSATGVVAIIGAIGSVMIPFLVVYESQGDLRDDISGYFNAGFWEDYGERDTDDRIPQPTSPLVLAVVAAAVVVRAIGAKVTGRVGWWTTPARQHVRSAIRIVTGYAEIVWIVLGAVVVRAAIGGAQQWLLDRRLGRGVDHWWDLVGQDLPAVDAVVDAVLAVLVRVLDGAVTGVVTPIAWLAIGVVVYGLTASDGISEDEVVRAVAGGKRLGRAARRVNPGVITFAWRRIADPEGRFGALLGGLAMIVRSGFVPVLVFCLVYTVLATGVPYAVWDLARALLARLDYGEWTAVWGPISAVVGILWLTVSAALVAAYADALLQRFGAPSQLRLRDQSTSSSM